MSQAGGRLTIVERSLAVVGSCFRDGNDLHKNTLWCRARGAKLNFGKLYYLFIKNGSFKIPPVY